MYDRGGLGHLDPSYVDDRQVAVGNDQIAAAVAAVVTGGEVFDHLHLNLRRRCAHRLDNVVALDIGVLFDLVSHLQGEQGQPDALVVGSGREPVNGVSTGEHPALRATPEPYVVPLGRAARNFLLVGEVLLAIEEMQRAHWRLGIAAPAERRRQDPPPAGQTQIVGPDPAGSRHGGMNLRLTTAQREVDRVPEQAVTGPGTADEVAGDIQPGQDAMHPGQQQVGEEHPEHDEQQHGPAGFDARPKHQVGQPDSRQTGEGEQRAVHHVHYRGPPLPAAPDRHELIVVDEPTLRHQRGAGDCRHSALRSGAGRITGERARCDRDNRIFGDLGVGNGAGEYVPPQR